jgi:hypothetical protein
MLWSREKYLASVRNWTRTVQHVARRYSSWAIPASPGFHLTSILGPKEVWVWYRNIWAPQHTGNWKQEGVCNSARWAAANWRNLLRHLERWSHFLRQHVQNRHETRLSSCLIRIVELFSVEMAVEVQTWQVAEIKDLWSWNAHAPEWFAARDTTSKTWLELHRCQMHRLRSVSWVLLVSDVTQGAVLVIPNLASFIEWIINHIESARKQPWPILREYPGNFLGKNWVSVRISCSCEVVSEPRSFRVRSDYILLCRVCSNVTL